MTVSMDGLRCLLYIRKVMINHHKLLYHLLYHIIIIIIIPHKYTISSLNKPLIIPHQVERGPEAGSPGSPGSREAWHVQSSTTGTWTLQKVWQKWDHWGARGCSDWDWGKQSTKNSNKNGVLVRSTWKICRFFFSMCFAVIRQALWLVGLQK